MQNESELLWSAPGGDIAEDLRIAHACMDVTDTTEDMRAAAEHYERARAAHDLADDRLRRNAFTSCDAIEQLGADLSRLRRRLTAYQDNGL